MFGDTQEILNEKVEQARLCNMGVVYCVGENLEERNAEESKSVIFEQL